MKRLKVKDLGYERVDVIVGAVLTGVIGLFVVVACAATLHVSGVEINDARDAAGRWSRSTAYSISEAFGRRADLNDSFAEAPASTSASAPSCSWR